MNALNAYIQEQERKPYTIPAVGATVIDRNGKPRKVIETARFTETGVITLEGDGLPHHPHTFAHPADLKPLSQTPVPRVRVAPPATPPVARVRTLPTTP